MSLAELKQSVLDLPAEQQRQFVVWLNQIASNYGDFPTPAFNSAEAKLKALEDLQKSVALTPEKAALWKKTVREGRR